MRVGYIGLGSQGGPMAQRIIDAGFTTTLWARRPEALEPYRGSGASFAPNPSELAAASDLVCLCVVNDDDVQQVFDAMLPGVAPGAVVAVQSTVHPSTMQTPGGRGRRSRGDGDRRAGERRWSGCSRGNAAGDGGR